MKINVHFGKNINFLHYVLNLFCNNNEFMWFELKHLSKPEKNSNL